MKRYTESGYCNAWGSDQAARRVAGLTAQEREDIRAGQKIYLAGCPAVNGQTDRVIVAIGGRFYTRIPDRDGEPC